MNCFAEDQLVELLDRGGLASTRTDERDHLDACAACRESWAMVAAAGEVLTDAGPSPSAARGWRLLPILAAAAMLLAIVGFIASRQTPPATSKPAQKDPVVLLLEGAPEESARAREALLRGGRRSMAGLLAARPKLQGSARLKVLQDLMFDIKLAAAAQDSAELAALQKLLAKRVDLQFKNTQLSDAIDFIRGFSGMNIVVDPMVENGTVDVLDVTNATLREALELVCTVKGLDFDARYGVVFISTPLRLWSGDPAVGLPAENFWSTQTLTLEERTVAEKFSLIRITIDMQNAPLSAISGYLTEISGLKFTQAPALADLAVKLKVADITLARMLELLTLPRAVDVRIENAAVIFFDRKK